MRLSTKVLCALCAIAMWGLVQTVEAQEKLPVCFLGFTYDPETRCVSFEVSSAIMDLTGEQRWPTLLYYADTLESSNQALEWYSYGDGLLSRFYNLSTVDASAVDVLYKSADKKPIHVRRPFTEWIPYTPSLSSESGARTFGICFSSVPITEQLIADFIEARRLFSPGPRIQIGN